MMHLIQTIVSTTGLIIATLALIHAVREALKQCQ